MATVISNLLLIWGFAISFSVGFILGIVYGVHRVHKKRIKEIKEQNNGKSTNKLR